jgi:hypothetical protein
MRDERDQRRDAGQYAEPLGRRARHQVLVQR